MSGLLERLGVELPVVQAGMGGGLGRHELAAAVSEAGGLGTLGILPPPVLAAELRAARERTSRPLAVNLLLPFARAAHWRVAADADAVVTFWGRPRRGTGKAWLHQCGSVREALAAQRAGADGVIVQGVESGGHVRGTHPALALLEQARAALPAGYPILLAGGLAGAGDVQRALAAGADAAVLGTRFLMSDESRAHAAYKQRVGEARATVLTELFGLGWPAAPHRVVRNRAVDRWLTGHDPRGPRAIRALHRVTGPVARRMAARQPARLQPGRLPPLTPQAPTDEHPSSLVETGPLYAGESATSIGRVRPAGDLVRELAGASAPAGEPRP
jgi:NAD(P)H-dependent flavin oxidoreductase YrpB (nitropropane dioxygenase family)